MVYLLTPLLALISVFPQEDEAPAQTKKIYTIHQHCQIDSDRLGIATLYALLQSPVMDLGVDIRYRNQKEPAWLLESDSNVTLYLEDLQEEVFTIAARSVDRGAARKALQVLIDAANRLETNLIRSAKRKLMMAEESVQRHREELEVLHARRQDLLEKSAFDPRTEFEIYQSLASELTRDLEKSRIEFKVYQRLRSYYEDRYKQSRETQTHRPNPERELLAAELAMLDAKLVDLEKSFTQNHPKVLVTREEITDLQNQIVVTPEFIEESSPRESEFEKGIVNSETKIAELSAKIDILGLQVAEMSIRSQEASRALNKLRRLENELEMSQRLVEITVQRAEETRAELDRQRIPAITPLGKAFTR